MGVQHFGVIYLILQVCLGAKARNCLLKGGCHIKGLEVLRYISHSRFWFSFACWLKQIWTAMCSSGAASGLGLRAFVINTISQVGGRNMSAYGDCHLPWTLRSWTFFGIARWPVTFSCNMFDNLRCQSSRCLDSTNVAFVVFRVVLFIVSRVVRPSSYLSLTASISYLFALRLPFLVSTPHILRLLRRWLIRCTVLDWCVLGVFLQSLPTPSSYASSDISEYHEEEEGEGDEEEQEEEEKEEKQET